MTDARFAILTNGRQFHFFTDIDETNKMDRRPFFVFDLEAHDEADTVELAKFHRDLFNVEEIAATAARLKYVSVAVAWLKGQMQSLEDEFVKLVGRQIHDGMLTWPVIDTLRGAVRGAFAEIIRDHIRERLDVAFPSQTPSPARDAAPSPEPAVSSGDIETTEEELMAFMVVQAIGAEIIAPERITIRDAKSYCVVFVDDTNRKPVCRFHFNAKSVKYVGLFDEAKTEARHMIESVTDLYAMRDDLHAAIRRYM